MEETVFTYLIDEQSFAISIFDNPDEDPMIYQTAYPNGQTFDSLEDSERWAKEFIAFRLGVSDLMPRMGADLPQNVFDREAAKASAKAYREGQKKKIDEQLAAQKEKGLEAKAKQESLPE